jgi:hypothetical protein
MIDPHRLLVLRAFAAAGSIGVGPALNTLSTYAAVDMRSCPVRRLSVGVS